MIQIAVETIRVVIIQQYVVEQIWEVQGNNGGVRQCGKIIILFTKIRLKDKQQFFYMVRVHSCRLEPAWLVVSSF